MYAQATIHTVVKTSVESGTHAVQLLNRFMKIYAPIFAKLNEFLLELGGGRMLTPEELAPILERFRGELPIDGPASLPDGIFSADGEDTAAAKKARDDLDRVVSNLKRQLNQDDFERFNGGGARARALSRAFAARGGGDARGGAVSSGGGVERAFAGVRRGAARAVKKVVKKAGACVPRRRSRSPSPATRVTRLKGGMTSAADNDPSCKELTAGGRTNPRTGVPSNLLADISRGMSQNALTQGLPFGG
jgi:hypothetical protein